MRNIYTILIWCSTYF